MSAVRAVPYAEIERGQARLDTRAGARLPRVERQGGEVVGPELRLENENRRAAVRGQRLLRRGLLRLQEPVGRVPLEQIPRGQGVSRTHPRTRQMFNCCPVSGGGRAGETPPPHRQCGTRAARPACRRAAPSSWRRQAALNCRRKPRDWARCESRPSTGAPSTRLLGDGLASVSQTATKRPEFAPIRWPSGIGENKAKCRTFPRIRGTQPHD